jgi:hypothetical protein
MGRAPLFSQDVSIHNASARHTTPNDPIGEILENL